MEKPRESGGGGSRGLFMACIVCCPILLGGLGVAGYTLYQQTVEVAALKQDKSEQAALTVKCQAELMAKGKSKIAAERERLALQADRERLSSQLTLEKQAPKGSLGAFFLAYESFSSLMRFNVEVQLEYQVSWRLRDEAAQEDEQISSALGKTSLLQGLWLGRVSNFVFGLVVLPDDDPALFFPADSDEFEPPEPVEEEGDWRRAWVDKTVEYEKADTPLKRLFHARILAVGPQDLQKKLEATVVSGWRDAGSGFSILILAAGVEGGEVNPGPDFVPEPLWLELTETQGVYPMSAPNGGIVLHKEHLGEAYKSDRRERPEDFTARDYYRDGWLRKSWDSIPGRLEVVFSPLPAGEQQAPANHVHSLVFPLRDRRSHWTPYWAVRERLLALPEINLARIPTWNTNLLGLAVLGHEVPLESQAEWSKKTCRTVFYDLLKRTPDSRTP